MAKQNNECWTQDYFLLDKCLFTEPWLTRTFNPKRLKL